MSTPRRRNSAGRFSLAPNRRGLFRRAAHRATLWAVCTKNSDSNVSVVQPADQRMRHDAADRLNRTR